MLVDGDDTDDAADAPAMVRLLADETLDMVTANRVTEMRSGYRVFSRRFVKAFPALALGFETGTGFTMQALDLRMPAGEVATMRRRARTRCRFARSGSCPGFWRGSIKMSQSWWMNPPRRVHHPIRTRTTAMLRPILLTLATVATALTWSAPPTSAADPPGATDNGLPPNASMTPNSMSDIHVQGKYNHSGIYVPPHYEPKPKPIFRGYFDQKKTTVKHGYFDTPKPVIPKTDQDDADQPGRR